jgi:hypothetical protein
MLENSRPRPLVTGSAARVLSFGCHYLHMAILLFILLGWLIPVPGVLMVHMVFVPSLIVIWYFNGGSCPLNNIENWLTKRVWRDPDNREEGSFVLVVVETYLGIKTTQKMMDMVTYAIMALAWLLSFGQIGAI